MLFINILTFLHFSIFSPYAFILYYFNINLHRMVKSCGRQLYVYLDVNRNTA